MNKEATYYQGEKASFNIEKLLARLDASIQLDEVEVFKTIDSTNAYAKRMASSEKTRLIIAEEQTAGIGRKQRVFYSPPAGLYVSLLFYPKLRVEKVHYVTIIAAIALVEVLGELSVGKIKANIKWLNDVYLNGKKISGILTEGRLIGQEYQYLVLGMGLNLYKTELPAELADRVTSIEQELNIVIEKELLLATFLNIFYTYYVALLANDLSFMDRYRAANFLIGKTIHLSDEAVPFQVKGINDRGYLEIIRGEKVEILQAGEVSLHGFTTRDR